MGIVIRIDSNSKSFQGGMERSPSVGAVFNVVCAVGRIPTIGAIKGVGPFNLAETIVLFLLVAFPEIVLVPPPWMAG